MKQHTRQIFESLLPVILAAASATAVAAGQERPHCLMEPMYSSIQVPQRGLLWLEGQEFHGVCGAAVSLASAETSVPPLAVFQGPTGSVIADTLRLALVSDTTGVHGAPASVTRFPEDVQRIYLLATEIPEATQLSSTWIAADAEGLPQESEFNRVALANYRTASGTWLCRRRESRCAWTVCGSDRAAPRRSG